MNQVPAAGGLMAWNGAPAGAPAVRKAKAKAPQPRPEESRRDGRNRLRTGHRFPAPALLGILVLLLVSAGLSRAAEMPRRGGTLRLWFARDWRSLDPAIAFDMDSTLLQKLLFRGLLDFDATGTQLVPDQASDWAVSPDGRTYTFHLKPGVRFAHGREVEAEDYVFSLQRILDPRTRSAGQSYFTDIAGAREFMDGQATNVAGLRAPDPRTLVIELARPAFTFRYVLTMVFASVVPRDLVRQYGADFQYHLVGSGPYRMTDWRRHVRMQFQRNPHYAGTDGWVEAVEITFGGDTSLHVMLVERGEADRAMADAVSTVRYERDPRRRSWLHRTGGVQTGYLFLNNELKPFDDPRVRRAVNHAIDKQRLIKFAGGLAVVANGIVPPAMPWTNPGLPTYEYSPDKARALLREAGLAAGFQTGLWYINTRWLDKRMAEGLQQDLRAVGIEVQLIGISASAFEVKVRSRGQVPAGIWGWVQDYPDPSNFLDVLFKGDQVNHEDRNNVAFYNNAEVNRLLGAASGSVEAGERLRLYRSIEALVMQDAPWVPLYHEQYPVICHPRLRGDVPHPVYPWRYENMWLAE